MKMDVKLGKKKSPHHYKLHLLQLIKTNSGFAGLKKMQVWQDPSCNQKSLESLHED